MKTDNIYNILSDYLKRDHSNSTNEIICRYMIEHFLDIPKMSVNEIAEACYTSHPSIIRFTREIGFEGMSDFKYAILDYADEIKDKRNRVNFPIEFLSKEEELYSSLQNWLNAQNDFVISSVQKNDWDQIFRLCTEIHDHENILLAGSGLSAVILDIFRILLARCGKVVNNIGAQLDALESCEREDTVLILLTMYGNFLTIMNQNGTSADIRKSIRKHCHSSWLFTLNKDIDMSLTDECVLVNAQEAGFELALNGTLLFFELIAESYQQMYAK